MTDYEGYLLLHHGGNSADPLFFTLSNGYLQYYSKEGGKWLGQIALTRHKIIIKAKKSQISPNHFIIMTVPSFSRYDTNRLPPSPTTYCAQIIKPLHHINTNITILELSTTTNENRMKWANAIHSWKRTNWKKSQYLASYDNELMALHSIMNSFELVPKIIKELLNYKTTKTKYSFQFNKNNQDLSPVSNTTYNSQNNKLNISSISMIREEKINKKIGTFDLMSKNKKLKMKIDRLKHLTFNRILSGPLA